MGYIRVNTGFTQVKLTWTLMFWYVTIMKDLVSNFMVYCWLSSQKISMYAVILEMGMTKG